MERWTKEFMDNQFIIEVLMFILTILQFKVSVESLRVQKNTNQKVDAIKNDILSEKDIKLKVLQDIQEDMDGDSMSFKIASILKRSYFRNMDMGINLELDNIFNKSKDLLCKMYENKK